ncbi:MAG TPA: UPF0182 family protein [Streptosporangiaceae bacterium]
MTFRSPGQPRPAASRPLVLPRWPKLLIPVAAGLVALIIVVSVVAGVWTDYLWFRSVGYTSVFGTTYGTKWLLFLVTAIFMAAVVGANAWLAYRLRPPFRPSAADQQSLEGYRTVVDPHRRLVLGVLLGLIGLITGLSAASSWRTWLLFANRTSFHTFDPQFHLDLSFFVFVYPFLRMVLTYLFTAVLISLVVAVIVHYLYGALRPQVKGHRATAAARAHLFVLVGVFVLLKAAAYFVDRYGIDFSQRGVVRTGASYTDVNAILPAKTVLAVIAVLCAVLFFAGAIRRNTLLPAVGFGLLVLSAVLIGGVYPAIIQQFVVKPNEQVKESPYISREIKYTRLAYGVSNVRSQPYQAGSSLSAAALGRLVSNLPDVRLMDPAVVSQTFQQLQQVKGYYKFPSVLAVDRYPQPGSATPQDTVIGVRDMDGPPSGQANWINSHLVYTHGFGVVAARASTAQANTGAPAFTESDIPPTGSLGLRQPRIYFGQQETSYAIVGGRQAELDYPNGSTGGQQNTRYTGGGGVPVGSPLNRLLYAIKFRQLNILLSGAIDGNSKIMYIRDPLSRVQKVAPFLTLDGDPYPVVWNGGIDWVVDAYTTTNDYPYSQRIGLGQASTDSYFPSGSVFGSPGQVNYVRNSVKAVVDAYTGKVTLYQWGTKDPILQTWMHAFPGVIQPRTDIPPALLAHLRYPEVLFEAQRQILAQYHVQQAEQFYGGQNFWTVPDDPSRSGQAGLSQPPYYLTLSSMPGYRKPKFSLVTSFNPRGRPNMAAFMAVDSNPASPGYGTIRLLELPQDTAFPGPGQVQNDFESDPTVASALTLLRQGGSRVTTGNLVTLPVGGGLVYFEPLYVSQSSGNSNSGSFPTLKRVLVYYNGTGTGTGSIGYAPTLSEALAQVFTVPGSPPPPPGGTGGGTGPPSSGGTANSTVQKYLQQAEDFYNQAQADLKNGDLAKYQADLAKVKAALDKAQQAAAGGSAAKPKTGATPQPSPSKSG